MGRQETLSALLLPHLALPVCLNTFPQYATHRPGKVKHVNTACLTPELRVLPRGPIAAGTRASRPLLLYPATLPPRKLREYPVAAEVSTLRRLLSPARPSRSRRLCRLQRQTGL